MRQGHQSARSLALWTSALDVTASWSITFWNAVAVPPTAVIFARTLAAECVADLIVRAMHDAVQEGRWNARCISDAPTPEWDQAAAGSCTY